MKIILGNKCEFPNCKRNATTLAYSRHLKKVGKYCEGCAGDVALEDSPEYIINCEHCGCRQGVN